MVRVECTNDVEEGNGVVFLDAGMQAAIQHDGATLECQQDARSTHLLPSAEWRNMHLINVLATAPLRRRRRR